VRTQGRREVQEAVIVAALTVVATKAIDLAFDYIKAAIERRRKDVGTDVKDSS